MLKRIIYSVAIALGVVLHGANASAGTVTVVEHLDVANIVPGLNTFTGGVQGVGPTGFQDAYSVEIAEGDIFDFTILFVGTLTIDNPTFLWAFSYSGSPDSDVDGRGTLQLLDSLGAPLYTTSEIESREGVVHFGQQFSSGNFLTPLPSSVTFGGLRYIGTLVDYVEPGLTTRTYNEPAFYFNADSFSVSSVPDAGSTMLLLGLGLTGLEAVRRRTRA